MSYNREEFPRYVRTAGKITMVTALAGLLVFLFAFTFDIGTQQLNHVIAANSNATTTLTVLNTPPAFTLNPYEVIGSSTSTPTNSGDVQQWSAVATDANGADYFLLLCSTNASPTPKSSAPPSCGAGAVEWGVSASTTSGTLSTVSTTTEEWGTGQFNESNNWYAWACDADSVDPRCSVFPEQGDYATSTSPFNINNRPTFSDFLNDGPVDPGGQLVFHSTSSDSDTAVDNKIYLVVCNSNTDYNASLNTCPNDFIASTTIDALSDAAATYTLPSIIRDQTYAAYGYIVDQFGHEALGNAKNADFDVNNVAPTVDPSRVSLNGGSNMSLSQPGTETTGFTLDFRILDANSCVNAASTSEILAYNVGVYRGTTTDAVTCDGSGTNYDPNNCYDNGVPTATWNLSCSATSTCASPNQDYMDYTCTFPLWFVADPTDNAANIPVAFQNDDWFAAVAGADDNYATGTAATTTNPVDLVSFSAIDILDAQIAYGSIEPGNDTGTLSATSTAQNVGNTGLDQESSGESMCGTFAVGNECPVSATSTVPEDQQQFASTSLAYGSALATTLSSTTYQQIELDVAKTTSTSTPNEGTTYWGIAVPASITLAGSYTGLNTFNAVTAEAVDW